MNITAEVKERADDCRADINRKRAALSDRLRRGDDMRSQQSATDLAQYLNEIAKLEGAERVWLQMRYMLESKPGIERDMLVTVLNSMLLEGADDTWSGRTNDVNRARYDGVRAACREFFEHW